MRKIVNKVLRPFGYEVVKRSEFWELMESRFPQDKPFSFLQVGAHDGVSHDKLFEFVTKRKISGVLIEPQPELFAALSANYGRFKKITPLNVAIHKTAKQMSLYRVNFENLSEAPAWADGIGSFDREHLVRSGIPESAIEEVVVSCQNIMEIIEKYELWSADYFQVDVEGYDLEVLRMIDFDKFRPKVIRFEIQSSQELENKEAFAILRQHGYSVGSNRADGFAYLNN